MQSVLALMIYPKSFSCVDLKEIMHKKQFKDYTISNARYDMRKLKGKKFVQKIKGKQNYQATKQGIQIHVISAMRMETRTKAIFGPCQ